MTISYSDTFLKLLLRWHGSVYKSLWRDLSIYLCLYYAINLTYRLGDWSPDQKQYFKEVVAYCEKASKYIPLTFLLGFYVYSIVGRWWDQFVWVAWPDRFMIYVTTYLRGPDFAVFRRTLARWCNLMSVLCWRNLSVRTVKRFPTMGHLVKAGLMTEQELRTYQTTEAPYGKWWLPIIWIGNLLHKAKEMNAIDPIQFTELMSELMAYRAGFGTLVIYDWVNIPLVYTQVVTIATYGYFSICLVGRQIHGIGEPDFYVPIFTILQFLFYMGWLKVGEDLMNPFGEDDDDFEMNYILDRNIQVAYMMGDDVHGQMPKLQKDLYWGQSNPILPHTRASLKKRDKIFEGHLAGMKLKDEEMNLVTADELLARVHTATGRFQQLVSQFSNRRKSTSSTDRGQPTTPAPGPGHANAIELLLNHKPPTQQNVPKESNETDE